MITILTPTYNRADYLPRLYHSLQAQTDKHFQWLIIDDGSTDGTQDWVQTLPQTEIAIDYYRKANGGKHTALNYSHPYIKGDIVLIVDSDDYLVDDAIETIEHDWKQYEKNSQICGMTYLRGSDRNTPFLENQFPIDGEISDSITRKVNSKRNADSCEVIRTSVLLEFPFPEFPDERFLGESYLWNLSGYKYKTVYYNRVLYVTEYLEGGLSKSGRRLRINCPLGGMENCKTYFDRRVCLKQRVKNTLLYICYGRFAHKSAAYIIAYSQQKIITIVCYLAGTALFHYWNTKYGD